MSDLQTMRAQLAMLEAALIERLAGGAVESSAASGQQVKFVVEPLHALENKIERLRDAIAMAEGRAPKGRGGRFVIAG